MTFSDGDHLFIDDSHTKTMAKTVLKVTILPCGRKVADGTGKEYEIDFNFSNLANVLRPSEGIAEQHFKPGTKERAQVLFSNKVEIL